MANTVTSQPEKAPLIGFSPPYEGYSQQMPMQGFSQQGVPPGTHPALAYMHQLDQIIIKQKVELLEVLCSLETRNKFEILNSQGQQFLFAREESGFCMRQCCGPVRGFVMRITDNHDQEVITATREFKCCAGCCWCANADCCAFELTIEAPPGNVVGYCRQQQSKWKGHLEIFDAHKNHVFTIWGPCCPCTCFCCPTDVNFPMNLFGTDRNGQYLAKDSIRYQFELLFLYLLKFATNGSSRFSSNGAENGGKHDVKLKLILDKSEKQRVGMISKQWSGALREMLTDADTLGLTFPRDLNIPLKATLLGTVFLIDFMFFERQQK